MLAIFAYLLASGTSLRPPTDSSWGGAAWESRSLPPAWYQQNALAALIRTVTQVAGGALLVAGLSLLLHTTSRLLAGWKGLAIRSALGARLGHLLALTVPELLSLAGLGSIVGLFTGLVLFAALGSSLPSLLSLRPSFSFGLLAFPASLLLALVLLVLPVLLLASHSTSNLKGDQLTTSGPILRLQTVLAVLQLSGLLIVTYAGALVLRGSPLTGPRGVILDTSEADIHSLRWESAEAKSPRERAAAYAALVEAIEGVNGGRAAITSPDAWLGLGKSIEVVAFCDMCFIGLNFQPMSYGRLRAVAVTPGSLEAMGVEPVRVRQSAGRMLRATDDFDAPPVVLISDQAARDLFPQGDPIGRIIRTSLAPRGDYTVVGVVRSIAPRGLGVSGRQLATIYFSALQHPPEVAEIAIPAGAPPDVLRRVMASRTPGELTAVLGDAEPLVAKAARMQQPLTWFALLLLAVAACGLALSLHAFGAVMMQLVSIRRREIAIRIALGARRRHVMAWVTGRGLVITGTGVLVGFSAARLVADLLHEHLSRSAEGDIFLLFGLSLAFGVLGLVAAGWPAIRASRFQPNEVLSDSRIVG